MTFKMSGWSGYKSPLEQNEEEEYQKNWPEGKITLEQQLKSFKADLALAEKKGDAEMVRKIRMDIASTKKEMALPKKPK